MRFWAVENMSEKVFFHIHKGEATRSEVQLLINPRSGMRYSNIHCVTGKGFCLKKSQKTYFGTMASTSITADEAQTQYP